MKNFLAVLAMIAGLSGVLAFTHAMQAEPAMHEHLYCLEERRVDFGWTNESPVLAEMAAIMHWQATLSESRPTFANWHHARNRYLVCRDLNGSNQVQCRISGLPCRYEDG